MNFVGKNVKIKIEVDFLTLGHDFMVASGLYPSAVPDKSCPQSFSPVPTSIF